MASISSMKRMAGACSRADANRSRARVAPTAADEQIHEARTGRRQERTSASPTTARAMSVAQLGRTGADPALPEPAASPLHDALNAVAAAAYAATAGHGSGQADLWPLPGGFGLARHLTTARVG
jgi:hypothetical protein